MGPYFMIMLSAPHWLKHHVTTILPSRGPYDGLQKADGGEDDTGGDTEITNQMLRFVSDTLLTSYLSTNNQLTSQLVMVSHD